MTPMDHGTAHERIEDLLLEPGRLAALATSERPEDVALRDHLQGCPACRADLDTWAELQSAVAEAMPGPDEDTASVLRPLDLPPSLRTRVLSAVRSPARDATPIPIPIAAAPMTGTPLERRARFRVLGPHRGPWLGLAAAFVVLVVGAGLLVDQSSRLAATREEVVSLGEAVAAVDRVLSTEHTVVPLRTTSGASAGSISWSRHDWVVLTTALAAPPAGSRYLCWLEADGRSVPVGSMDFADGTAYWVATVDAWKTWEIGPTTQFVVSLEEGTPASRTGDAILSASLGS